MCSGVSKMGEKGFCLSLDVSHALITPWKERAHKLLGLTRERGFLMEGGFLKSITTCLAIPSQR